MIMQQVAKVKMMGYIQISSSSFSFSQCKPKALLALQVNPPESDNAEPLAIYTRRKTK